jgi:hypothetical protein
VAFTGRRTCLVVACQSGAAAECSCVLLRAVESSLLSCAGRAEHRVLHFVRASAERHVDLTCCHSTDSSIIDNRVRLWCGAVWNDNQKRSQ